MKFYTKECFQISNSSSDAEYKERVVSGISIGMDKDAVEKIDEIQESLRNYPTASVLQVDLKFLNANIVRQYYFDEMCEDKKLNELSFFGSKYKSDDDYIVHDSMPDFKGKIEEKEEVVDQELLFISSTGVDLHIIPADEDALTACIEFDSILSAVRESPDDEKIKFKM